MIDFLARTEPLWLLIILLAGLAIEFHSNFMLRKEFDYDKEKDELKARRKTRTTKKTTQAKDGSSVVEESTEVTEPIQEEKK